MCVVVFFFSSRRRHTRFDCDWSSDVCSSDLKVAALRAPVPILAVTTESATFRQLALVWGVTPVLVDHVPSYDAMLAVVRDLLLKRGYAQAGDRIVMTAGVPWEVSGATNLLKVEVV